MRRRLSSFGPLRRTYIASPDGSGFCLRPRVYQRCVTIGGTLVRRCGALRCVVTVCLALAGFACADNHRTGVPGVSPVSTTSVSPVRLTPPPSTRCRLPVAGYQGGRRFWAGFLDLSSGRAIPADLPAGSPTASMVSYDPIGKRWLPVPERAVSPDGRSYARLDITPAQTSRPASARLYVVDVATEDSRLVWQSSGPNVAIVGWDDGVVLLNRLVGEVNREQGRSNGRFADFTTLWAVDSTGATPPRQIGPAQADYEYFSASAIHGGFAWGFGPARPSEPQHSELRRLDIRTGLLADYIALDPGLEAGPLALDSTGRLAILLRPASAPPPSPGAAAPAAESGLPKVVVWDGTTRAAELALPSDFASGSSYGLDIHLDIRGVWLIAHAGLWFWSARDGGLTSVGDLSRLAGAGRPTAGLRFTVAGACQ